MAYRVTWSPQAIDDLESIAEYIAVDSTAYAATVVTTILNITRNLSRFPLAGRVVPEFGDERLREWFVYSYRVIYRIENDVVIVTTIVHGRRLLILE